MCTVCGCDGATIDAEAGTRAHAHPIHDTPYHHHDETGDIDFGAGLAGVHVTGMSQDRIIQLEHDVLSSNNTYATINRMRLHAAGVFALNLVASPGSGKTTLMVRVIADLRSRFEISVIEGDQQTSNDADRIRATGAPAIQINTGKGCHLDAHMVGHALDKLPLPSGGLLFIENVGNLVCPAAFDLGEAHKVVVLSVTEGEDKPIKYPDMFASADVMLLNKSDLLPHLEFDVAACLKFARRANPKIEIFVVSARTGEGLPAFYDWIEAHARPHAAAG